MALEGSVLLTDGWSWLKNSQQNVCLRESGENPERARHCKWGRNLKYATSMLWPRYGPVLAWWEGSGSRMIHKSGYRKQARKSWFLAKAQ